MSMGDEFDSLLGSENPLQTLDELIWKCLTDGIASGDHPWNLAALATASMSGVPKCRTVVLREVDPDEHAIACYTDVRSLKVNELSQPDSQAAWMFYDRDSKIQLRLEGTTQVISGPQADQAWNDTPLESRAAYLSIATPGRVSDDPRPPDTSDRLVTHEESERGRRNFRIVRSVIRQLDWLYLKKDGHVRATVEFQSDGQHKARWIVP